jgi:DNA-binding NtrC family response regulator
MSLHDDSAVHLHDSPDDLGLGDLERLARNGDTRAPLPLREWIALAEAWRIALALRETRGNRAAAARALGIGRRTLYSKMAKLGLEPAWGIPRIRSGFAAHSAGPDNDRCG